MADNVNDNEFPLVRSDLPVPDAQGQAAMLLVESLIHGLIARSVITVADAVEIINVAVEVRTEVGTELGDTPATLARSLAMLSALGDSLSRDA